MQSLALASGAPDSFIEFWTAYQATLRQIDAATHAYLGYMTARLLAMRRLLKPSGSLYLHCDRSAAHSLKLALDGIFGKANFLNELVWHYKNASRGKHKFAHAHDTIFWYKHGGAPHTFNRAAVLQPYESGMTAWRAQKAGKPPPAGKTPDDVITLAALNTRARERTGYPTQKPLALLKTLITAATREGDTVLDPFCGGATTIVAAHTQGRRWMGIDIAYHTINHIVKKRLGGHDPALILTEGVDYAVRGIPRTLESAVALWQKDPYQFQQWAVEQVSGIAGQKRGNDGGIDGRLYFDLPDQKTLPCMIIEVKGGATLTRESLRALRGAMERDGAAMAGLIVRAIAPTQRRHFADEMQKAGLYDTGKKQYPKMQLLTLSDVLAGKTFDTPRPYRWTDRQLL